MNVHALPTSERPRERLRELGARALADGELLALVVGCGRPGESALQLGHRILGEAGGLSRLARRSPEEWLSVPGVGQARAARLAAVFEIARRVRAPAPRRGRPIRNPREVADYLVARWAEERSEAFGLLLLDARNRLVREHMVSRGGWSASVVRPREVFRQALLSGAPALILFHNHPSGDPAPSREDVQITKVLVEAGELLGIRVLDHLIVGAEGYASLRERGLM